MARETKQERERRIALVQQRIGERGWSMSVMRSLAKEIGVTSRTIRTYRSEVVASMRKEIGESDGEQIRAEFLDRLRGHQQQALQDGRFGPLSAMLSIESRIVGLDVPPPPRQEDQIGAMSRSELLAGIADDLTAAEVRKLQQIKASK